VGTDGEALRGAGIVIDPGHLDAELGLAVRLLIETPELSSQLGRLARQRVVERFSLSTNIDRLLELYERLLTPRVAHS
jgi:glycosyltransferase involved in cell wall biosynthesis